MPHQPVEVNRGRIAAAFVVLTVVFSLVIGWEANLSREATRLSRENARRLHDIEAERGARVKAIKETTLALCRQGNATNAHIVAFIVASSEPARFRKVAYYREHPNEIPNVKVVAEKARKAFPQQDCKQQPAQKVK